MKKIRDMIANAKDADELEKILRENTNLSEAEIQDFVKKKALLVKKDKTLRLDALGKIYARLIRNKNLGVETAFCDAASSLDNFVISPIYYETDVYSIEKKSANRLFENVDKIIDSVDAYPGMLLQTEGNCDVRGSNVYNKNLGDYRWTGTVPLLVSMQFDRDRIRVISKGEECSIEKSASMDDNTWWSKNRRTDFTWVLNN
jgi:outer membrane protein OmpA-like peptidoglycan-associated protein